MAKATVGPVVADARGSIGAYTYYRGRSGLIIRNRIQPDQTLTARRQAIRDLYVTIKNSWHNRTDNQAALWERFAQRCHKNNTLGRPRRWTAWNAFLSVNMRRQNAGLSIIASPPTILAVDYLRSFSVAMSASATPRVAVSFTPSPPSNNTVICWWASAMKPTSIINLRKYIRWLTFSSLGPVSPVDLTTEYEARWGTVVAGKAVGWYAIITDVNGSHAFPPLYFRCLTTA